jgi:putative DNA primase/helicase
MANAPPFDNNAAKREANTVLQAALAYLRAGLSVIPVRSDGSKAPDVPEWKPYQQNPPTQDEVEDWFDRPQPPGVAVVGGKVSGNLEQLDFDSQADEIIPRWCELVDEECPGLLRRLTIVQTPRKPLGIHARYRCSEVTIPGNTKLAVDPSLPKGQQTLIETRGEGGYALAPGCPPECHENGTTYDHQAGPKLSQVQTISAGEREVLLRCARSFTREADEPADKSRHSGTGTSPGDDFNARGPDWPELLEPHGWQLARQADGARFWRRPGKEGPGWSATTGYCTGKAGQELFACFSENAEPFQGSGNGKNCTCYSKFAVYTRLNHGGDFKAATTALRQQGYGTQKNKAHENNGQEEAQAGKEYALGPLTLQSGRPRQTPTKVTVPVTVAAWRG